jgi:hypothetical protein
VTNRIGELLATQVIALPVRADFVARLTDVRTWEGEEIPPAMCARFVSPA